MIGVAIIEDNLSFMKALQVLISAQSDMLLLYTSDNLADIRNLCASSPDVVIMDINLPDGSGIDAVKKLKILLPSAGVFMLTVFEDEDKIFDSIKAGACGYLLKKDPPAKILEAIYAVQRGESIVNGKIARKIMDYFMQRENGRKQQLEAYNLTSKEKEILQFLIEGRSYKHISTSCSISINTLFNHVKNIYSKLNMHSRAEIAAKFH